MPPLPKRKGLPQPKKVTGHGKRRMQVLKLKEPRRLSNADDCVGYIVRTKPRVMVGPTDYGLREGKILDAFTGEHKEGVRIVAYHIELDFYVLEYVAAHDIDWIAKPKE